MATVTREENHGLTVIYDDEKGWYIEGRAPWVPEDKAPGWVCFELPPSATKIAVMAILDTLGFTRLQTMDILEEF